MSFLKSPTRTDPRSGPPPRRTAAGVFIYITILLDMMAMGVTLPVLPKLIQSLGGGGADHVARTFGLFATVFAVMQFLAQPVQGALSDRFGRRPIILASNFGLGADYLVMALAPTLPWLFLGRMISGAAAGSFTAATAYMADISEAEDRAGGFGQIFGAASLGIILGPTIGGLVSTIDPRAPFWLAAGLSCANGLYGLFILPESLKAADRAPVVWSQLNPVGGMAFLVKRYPVLLGMILVVLLFGLAWQGVYPLFTIYSTYRYAWKPADIGIFLGVLGVMNFIVTTWVVDPVTRRLGERMTALIGMGFQSLSLVLFALAGQAWIFWCAAPLLALGNLGGPAWQSLTSNMVGPSEQGRLAAAFGGMFSIAGMAAPIAFTSLFALEVGRGAAGGFWLGAPFFAATVLSAAALGLAAWATRNHRQVGTPLGGV
jgi:MFS transporter, DHA1 family, tetracycline resistance protein